MKLTRIAMAALAVAFTFQSSSVSAYTAQVLDQNVTPTSVFEMAKKERLGIPPSEREAKTELLALKKRNPEKYKERKEDLSNSYIREVDSGKMGDVERAKVIARFHFYEAIRKDWEKTKTTPINEIAGQKFSEFAPFLRNQLQKLEFVPDDNVKDAYRFDWKWGTALVSKDLRKIRWRITSSYHMDTNKLPEGADKITVPESPGSGRSETSGSSDFGSEL